MSDTSPKDQRSLVYGHVPPAVARAPRQGEVVWQLTKDGHTIACALLNDDRVGAGWEVVISQDGEWSFGRRCADEALARFTADALKQDQVKAGWTASPLGDNPQST